MCETVCPHGVFAVDNAKARIAVRDACMECGACARNCPEAAITVRAGVGCAAAVMASYLSSATDGRPCCG